MPVAERCRIARARQDLSLKDAARALRVPQFRLKDIDGNRVGAVDQAVLVLYIELLDIEILESHAGARANAGVQDR